MKVSTNFCTACPFWFLLFLIATTNLALNIHVSTKIETPKSDADSKKWLVATAGTCYLFEETSSIASSRSISFAFSPRSYIRFTDYPYHSTLTLTDTEKMVIDLADPGWDHRNVAIVFEAMSVHHDISIYEVSSHQTTDNNDAV